MEINKTNSIWKLIFEIEKKKGVSEILINDPKKIFIEREGKLVQLDYEILVSDYAPFIEDIIKMNEEAYRKGDPIVDGSLVDGSRINIIMPPFSDKYPAITIRKYILKNINLMQNGHEFGMIEHTSQLLRAMVKAKMNIVVCGGTGAGKTTFLNMLMSEIDQNDRVITIEDTFELQINKPNVVRLMSNRWTKNDVKLMPRDLVKNALRMRPDRIIIGESRGGEIFDLFQAMNTGHNGSFTTIHANSSQEVFSRMESLFMLAGFDLPIKAIRKQISTAIDFVLYIGRDSQGQRRLLEVREITGMEGELIQSHPIAESKTGEFKFSGLASTRLKRLHEIGGIPLDFFKD